MTDKAWHLLLLLIFFGALTLSAMHSYDLFTWFLEVLPALLGVIVLTATYKSFQFTNLAYGLMWIYTIILLVGGHYTYAEMPLFNWLRDSFDLGRNYYDRLGHFAQGFILAILAREVLLKKSPMVHGKLLTFTVISTCLGISAAYELLEFFAASVTGEVADAFLGGQGDMWDTQWNMTFVLIGAIISLCTLTKYHDAQLQKIGRW